MNRKRREARAELVRQYLETITSDDQSLVCFFLMQGLEPEDICRRLKISRERHDMYPEHAGVVLPEHYATREDVETLLALGDLSFPRCSFNALF